jgi:hypothetical protein
MRNRCSAASAMIGSIRKSSWGLRVWLLAALHLQTSSGSSAGWAQIRALDFASEFANLPAQASTWNARGL